MKQGKRGYYLGLDIGTDSIGYAVTDEQYHLLRFHGNDVWGSHVFDSASLCDERRGFRSARRRLDRRQVLPFQAQMSGITNPYTKNCLNALV